MEENIKKNDKCFIGMPSCGYIYESAKSCFVACPSDEKYTLKLEIIRNILEAKQYECHVALKMIDPGNFAFCTKICSKIIQAKFCIVLLDPSLNKKNEYPNPNVHFEYGMMISQNKNVIPLQDEKNTLSFNIFPLDTIKYNDGNFKEKVSNAIQHTIERSESKTDHGQSKPALEIFTYYNIQGFQLSNVKETFMNLLYGFGETLGFYLFNNKSTVKYKFIGPFDNEDPKKTILHTKLLIDNISSTYKRIVSDLKSEEEKKKYLYMINDISIDLIISPFYDKNEVLERIMTISKSEYNYPIIIHYRSDFEEYVNKEYKNIGEIKLIKK